MTDDQTIGLTQVVHLTGIGRDRLYLMMRADLFPHQHGTGGWSQAEVLDWMRKNGGRQH